MVQARKGVSSLVATIMLVVIGGMLAVSLMAWNTVGIFNVAGGKAELEFLSVLSVNSVSIDNAGSQLVLFISNNGDGEAVVDKIYFNSLLVTEKGFMDGDLLPDARTIATSIPEEGQIISPGGTVKVFIWIGEDLDLVGCESVIHLQSHQSIRLKKTVTTK